VNQEPDVVAIIRMMRTLDPQTRRVFTLRKVYGLSHRAIGTRLSIKLADVERHLVVAALACAHALDSIPPPQEPV
jgi:DNA-directed RNA polymerase specialized sigma24 family protein